MVDVSVTYELSEDAIETAWRIEKLDDDSIDTLFNDVLKVIEKLETEGYREVDSAMEDCRLSENFDQTMIRALVMNIAKVDGVDLGI